MKNTKKKAERHSWTKQQIKKVIELWSTTSTAELAEEIDVAPQKINYIASQIRKSGYKLPRKSVQGQLQTLIREVVGEM